MEIIFFILVFLSLYSYGLFPILLFVLAKTFGNHWRRAQENLPISIIVSAYNEENVIKEKIVNTLDLVYPHELFEVIVSSDGSTDGTNEIVTSMQGPNVILKPFDERLGKTACLNRVVPQASGDIILFTDANSLFPPELLNKLVRHFADPDVGLVTGWTKYRGASETQETTGIYSRFEMWTKSQESLISSCVGADGAIFALRKTLFRSLREDDINDFVIPLQVIQQGKRVVMDPEVFCFEEPSKKVGGEYQRQVRISTRTLGAIYRNIGFLNPFKFGSFSFFLFSHKLMRFLVPFFIIATFSVNLFLLNSSTFFLITLCGQTFFFIIGISSALGIYNGPFSGLIKFFLVTTAAQLVGWIRMLSGIKDTVWNSQR